MNKKWLFYNGNVMANVKKITIAVNCEKIILLPTYLKIQFLLYRRCFILLKLIPQMHKCFSIN